MPLPAFRGHFVHAANRHRRWQWPTTAPVWNWSVRWRIRIWLGGRIHASSGIHVSHVPKGELDLAAVILRGEGARSSG